MGTETCPYSVLDVAQLLQSRYAYISGIDNSCLHFIMFKICFYIYKKAESQENLSVEKIPLIADSTCSCQ